MFAPEPRNMRRVAHRRVCGEATSVCDTTYAARRTNISAAHPRRPIHMAWDERNGCLSAEPLKRW